MTITTLLIILLLLALFGGIVPWRGYGSMPPAPGAVTPQQANDPRLWHGYGYGPYVPGGIGIIVLILIVLVVSGRI